MKRRLAFALVGLAISFASPTLAQENDAVDPETRQELEAVDTKLDQAIDKNDAVAAAALFTEDAILMLPFAFAPERTGIFSGRSAIGNRILDSNLQHYDPKSHTYTQLSCSMPSSTGCFERSRPIPVKAASKMSSKLGISRAAISGKC